MPPSEPGHDLGQLILNLPGQRVILDADLAVPCDVPTGAFNQAIKRNAERFPTGFASLLARKEPAVLKSCAPQKIGF
jgi:hypothetical protein